MAVPAFGFSFGDFVAGINLVKGVIEALNDSVGAKLQYQRLITELINLEHIAIEQAALQSQQSIEDFLRRNAKFKTSLGTIGFIQGRYG